MKKSILIAGGALIGLAVVVAAAFMLVTAAADRREAQAERLKAEAELRYVTAMRDLALEWNDAMDVASSSVRLTMSGPVETLQSVRRKYQQVEPPAKYAQSHRLLLEQSDAYISALLLFMKDDPGQEEAMLKVRQLSDERLAALRQDSGLTDVPNYQSLWEVLTATLAQ